MKKLIKADLIGILELVPVYQPVEQERMEQVIANLECGEAEDYLFLSRRGLCRLSTMAAAYDRNNFANSDWLAFRGMNLWPIIALFLHVDEVVDKRPWGSVTLLDYQTAAKDINTFSQLPERQCRRHAELMARRYAGQTRYCSMLEVIQYLKTGR